MRFLISTSHKGSTPFFAVTDPFPSPSKSQQGKTTSSPPRSQGRAAPSQPTKSPFLTFPSESPNLPFVGVWRACQSIANARPFEKNPLERAKYAGALCMVMGYTISSLSGVSELRGCRIKGKIPPTGDEDGFVGCVVRTKDYWAAYDLGKAHPGQQKIQGCCVLPMYRYLQTVPPDFKVVSLCQDTTKVELSCSNSLVKCGIAIVQVGFACYTLYQTRSNQVEAYGFAAFGLTVVSYAIMSLINLTVNLLTPEYPSIFMVHSDYMDALTEGPSETQFDGIIGTVVPRKAPSDSGYYDSIPARLPDSVMEASMNASIQVPTAYLGASEEPFEVEISVFGRHETIPTFQKSQQIRNVMAIGIGILALVLPYILIGIFTGFQKGAISTPLQRGFVRSWLVVGQVCGAYVGLLGHEDGTEGFDPTDLNPAEFIGTILFILLLFSPAVGGFVCRDHDQAVRFLRGGLIYITISILQTTSANEIKIRAPHHQGLNLSNDKEVVLFKYTPISITLKSTIPMIGEPKCLKGHENLRRVWCSSLSSLSFVDLDTLPQDKFY